MLLLTDTTRDVLCNEVIELDKCLQATSTAINKDMRDHICNIVNLLLDEHSFCHVPVNVNSTEIETITEIAKYIVSQRTVK